MGDRRPDSDLLRDADDPDAFAVFYRRHSAAVLGYLRYRTGDIEAAADLTAEVFAAAFAARRRYVDQGGEPARAWLFGIANNLVAMRWRRQRRARAASRRLGMQRIEFADEALERADDELDVWLGGSPASRLVDDLPYEMREAVLARIVHERSYREIARDQKASEAAVRQRVSRGLARVADGLRKDTP